MPGSLCCIGTLDLLGSLYQNGTLPDHGSLDYPGTLGKSGSLPIIGTLFTDGSLDTFGTLLPIGFPAYAIGQLGGLIISVCFRWSITYGLGGCVPKCST